MSLPVQNNAQPAPIILTIPNQSNSQSDKQHISKVFPKSTILTLSIIQVICGALAAITQVVLLGISDRYWSISNVGTGIWTGFLFGISGGVGLIASNRPSNCTIIAYMVWSIISALFCLPLIVISGIGFGEGRYGYRSGQRGYSNVFYGLQLLIGLLQGVVAIVASSFSCRAVCCGRKQYPGAVIFSSGTNPDQQYTTIPLNQIVQAIPQTSVPAEATNFVNPENEKPPSYDTAAINLPEDGDRYQRFVNPTNTDE